MEKFSLSKHWTKFVEDDLVVKCPTEELANEFLKYCQSKGIRWSSGDSLTSNNNWRSYKEDTYYHCDCLRMTYGMSLASYQMVEFKGFKEEAKKNDRTETIEVIYNGLETIVLIKGNGKYAKGTSKCMPQDPYNREIGFLLAYTRARLSQLEITNI